MDHRIALLQALRSLACGHAIHHGGETSRAMYLEGARDVCLVFDELLARRWISGDCRSASPVYRITPTGLDAFRDGLAWWSSLSLIQRLLAHLMPLPQVEPDPAPCLEEADGIAALARSDGA